MKPISRESQSFTQTFIFIPFTVWNNKKVLTDKEKTSDRNIGGEYLPLPSLHLTQLCSCWVSLIGGKCCKQQQIIFRSYQNNKSKRPFQKSATKYITAGLLGRYKLDQPVKTLCHLNCWREPCAVSAYLRPVSSLLYLDEINTTTQYKFRSCVHNVMSSGKRQLSFYLVELWQLLLWLTQLLLYFKITA